MHIGTVKNFDIKLGFGFITDDDTNEDIFVYVTAFDRNVIRNLHAGQKVSFDICDDRGKRAACNIKMVNAKPATVCMLN